MARCLIAAVVVVGLSPWLAAQSTSRWVQPYPQLPEYRELVGRLFGDSAASNDDPRFENVTTPAVLAVGMFKSRAKPGDTIVSYGMVTYSTGADNLPDFANLRLVIKDTTEVRFSLAGTRGVNLDTRKGTLSQAYQQCLDVRLPRLMYLIDARWQAMTQCQRSIFWSSWMRNPPSPFSGTFSIDGVTTLDYAWDAAAGEVRLTLK